MHHLTTISLSIKSLGWKIVLPVLALFIPIIPFMLLIGGAIIIDTILGIYASKKHKVEIISYKLFNIAIKFFIYTGAILFIHQLDIRILGDFIGLFIGIPLALTKIGGLILLSVELFSIDEKMRKINGKGFWFYIKRVLSAFNKFKMTAKENGIDITDIPFDGKNKEDEK